MSASVKIMLSYDYCHFEICLGSDENLSLEQVDNMRKDAQRLADKAVNQYKIAKNVASHMIYGGEKSQLEKEVRIIQENFPKSEWTNTQKATIKALEDFKYYDYQDDWEDPGDY
ncbi:MAG TPA: hypothetical protein VGD14_01100 [bacterium]